MEQPHSLGVSGPSQAAIEAVDPKFLVEGLLQARGKTIHALEEIRKNLKEGMTEEDGRKLSLEVFSGLGAKKHWHRPYVRFGKGTTLTFNEPQATDYRLQPNDPYYFDFGPVWPDGELEYEGDYGDTFVFGQNPEAEKCAQAARQIFDEAKSLWKQHQASGQALYEFLRRRSLELNYKLRDDVNGHRLADFPHHKYSKDQLAKTSFYPSDSLWVLEVHLSDPAMRFGAFFEDLL